VHSDVFRELVSELKLMRADYSKEKHKEALNKVIEPGLEFLLTKERNNTRSKIGGNFRKLIEAEQKKLRD
jgi:hypothetical protein